MTRPRTRDLVAGLVYVLGIVACRLLARSLGATDASPPHSAANEPLTVLFTGVVAALGVAMPLISSGHATLNSATIQAIIGAGAVAALSALEKLFSAKGDASAPTPPAA